MSIPTLFSQPLAVINVGLQGFADNVVAAGGECVGLQWQPPALGDREGGVALAAVFRHPAVEEANAVALARFLQAQPVLIDIAVARDVLPGMAAGRRLIVHAGPPIEWASMCGPMRGAILGAAVLEGWADTVEQAEAPAGARRRRPRTLPPRRRGGADGGDHQPVDARLRGREHGQRPPRLLQLQRGPGQGAALRRQRARGHRAAAPDGAGDRPDLARGAGPQRAHRAQAADGAGPEHGRRGAQPQRRGVRAVHQARGAGADRGRGLRVPTPPPRCPSSPPTTTSSSTCRWRPASRCATPQRACRAVRW